MRHIVVRKRLIVARKRLSFLQQSVSPIRLDAVDVAVAAAIEKTTNRRLVGTIQAPARATANATVFAST